jgi:hypothetical protein
MTLIEGNSSAIREEIWPFMKGYLSILWLGVARTFIEMELFHDKRINLTFYVNLSVHFNATKSWWNLLNGSSSTIREGNLRF